MQIQDQGLMWNPAVLRSPHEHGEVHFASVDAMNPENPHSDLLSSSVVSRVPINMSTQAPTFTQPLQSVVALEGSAATFEAQVSGKFYGPVQLSSTFLKHGSAKASSCDEEKTSTSRL